MRAKKARSTAVAIIPTAAPPTVEPTWVERICAAYHKTVEGFVEAGRLLLEAKEALPHGDFEAMIERELPFTPSTARRLMAIAGDQRISDRSHANVLPIAWGTLYELTQLSDEDFNSALERGAINPGIRRRDVAGLRSARPKRSRRSHAEPIARASQPPPDLALDEVRTMYVEHLVEMPRVDRAAEINVLIERAGLLGADLVPGAP